MILVLILLFLAYVAVGSLLSVVAGKYEIMIYDESDTLFVIFLWPFGLCMLAIDALGKWCFKAGKKLRNAEKTK